MVLGYKRFPHSFQWPWKHIWNCSEMGVALRWFCKISISEPVKILNVYFLSSVVSPLNRNSTVISDLLLERSPSPPSHKQHGYNQILGSECEVPVKLGLGRSLVVGGPQSRRRSVRNRKNDGVAYWKCECQSKYRTESHSGGEMRVKCWSVCRDSLNRREAGEKGVGDTSSNLRFFIFYGRKYSWVIFSLNTRRVTHSHQPCWWRATVSLFTSH